MIAVPDLGVTIVGGQLMQRCKRLVVGSRVRIAGRGPELVAVVKLEETTIGEIAPETIRFGGWEHSAGDWRLAVAVKWCADVGDPILVVWWETIPVAAAPEAELPTTGR